MCPRISLRGCVRPSVGPSVRRSVGPSVRNAFVKIAENEKIRANLHEIRLRDASYVVYTAVVFFNDG